MGEFKSSQSLRITSRSCYLEDFIGMFRRTCVCMNGIKQPFLCFQWAETICKHCLFQFTTLLCFTLQSVTTLNIITPALSCCLFFFSWNPSSSSNWYKLGPLFKYIVCKWILKSCHTFTFWNWVMVCWEILDCDCSRVIMFILNL